MKFDMGQAWTDAVGLMRANREVLAIVAGVFFLLPGLAIAVLFADQQAQAMAILQSMMQGQAGGGPVAIDPAQMLPDWFGVVVFSALVVQLVGYLTLLAIMDDMRRPTVGEAISIALRCILPLIGAVIVFVIGYIVVAFVVALVLGLLIAGLTAASGSGAVVGLLSIVLSVAIMVAVFYVMVRFSMTMPEIVLGRTLNPIKALVRSWRLTQRNTARLFAFYVLLAVVYLVISALVFGIFLALVSIVASGSVAGLLNGVISGVAGLIAGIVMTALLAAIYRQLAGDTLERLRETFE